MAKVNIGFFSDTPYVSKYVYDVVNRCTEHPETVNIYLILNSPTLATKPSRRFLDWLYAFEISRVMCKLTFAFVMTIEKFLLARSSGNKNHLSRFDVSSLASGVVKINFKKTRFNSIPEYTEDQIKKISDLNLGLIYYFGKPTRIIS